MEDFFVGNWSHKAPYEKDMQIIVVERLCWGPLETYTVGISDGKYFREEHIIEGIDEGAKYYNELTKDEFNNELEYEISMCLKYGLEERAELVRNYLAK